MCFSLFFPLVETHTVVLEVCDLLIDELDAAAAVAAAAVAARMLHCDRECFGKRLHAAASVRTCESCHRLNHTQEHHTRKQSRAKNTCQYVQLRQVSNESLNLLETLGGQQTRNRCDSLSFK